MNAATDPKVCELCGRPTFFTHRPVDCENITANEERGFVRGESWAEECVRKVMTEEVGR